MTANPLLETLIPLVADLSRELDDDERYRRLRAAGWTVIRLSAADLRDMERIVARIAEALQSGVLA